MLKCGNWSENRNDYPNQPNPFSLIQSVVCFKIIPLYPQIKGLKVFYNNV
jgi:hypothetical protein